MISSLILLFSSHYSSSIQVTIIALVHWERYARSFCYLLSSLIYWSICRCIYTMLNYLSRIMSTIFVVSEYKYKHDYYYCIYTNSNTKLKTCELCLRLASNHILPCHIHISRVLCLNSCNLCVRIMKCFIFCNLQSLICLQCHEITFTESRPWYATRYLQVSVSPSSKLITKYTTLGFTCKSKFINCRMNYYSEHHVLSNSFKYFQTSLYIFKCCKNKVSAFLLLFAKPYSKSDYPTLCINVHAHCHTHHPRWSLIYA